MAEVFALEAELHDVLADISLSRQCYPELLSIIADRAGPHKIIYNLAVADAAQFDALALDQLLHVTFGTGRDVDRLRDREVLREDDSDWRVAPAGKVLGEMGFGFLG